MEHTCSSALTPQEGEGGGQGAPCVRVYVCAQVFSMLLLSECAFLSSEVSVCVICDYLETGMHVCLMQYSVCVCVCVSVSVSAELKGHNDLTSAVCKCA